MTSYGWSSAEICAMRVTKLNCDGTSAPGPLNGYTTCGVVSFGMTRNVERGEERRYKSASGCICAHKRNRDQLVNLDVSLKLCPMLDPELNALLSKDGVVVDAGISIGGFAETTTPVCGCEDCGAPCNTDDVAVEWWTRAWDGRKQAVQGNQCVFWHWAIPRVQFTIGDFTFDNEIMSQTYNGYSIDNANWGAGIGANTFTAPVIRPYHYELTTTPPPACLVGLQTYP